ncbi:MAG: hypothetical protein AAF996_09545 [Pseudomonadota bacterium]
MDTEAKRGLSDGRTAALAVLGAIATGFALFNLVIDIFRLELSPLTEPLVSFYQNNLESFFAWVESYADWLIPDWNPHVTVLAAICAALAARLATTYPDIFGEDEANFFVSVFFLPTFFAFLAIGIPIFRIYFSLGMTGIVLLTLIQGIFGKEYREPAFYILGVIATTVCWLVINWYS